MQIDGDKMPIIVICWVKLKFDHGIRSANIDFGFSDAKLQTELILNKKSVLWYKNPRCKSKCPSLVVKISDHVKF
jgi:hypothetical protein